MNLDRTSVIGIVICVLAYVGYEQFLTQKYPDRYKAKEPIAQDIETKDNSSSKSKEQNSQETLTENSEENLNHSEKLLTQTELTLENDTVRYILDQKTGGFQSVLLKNYQDDSRESFVNLIDERFYLKGSADARFSYPAKPYKAIRVDEKSIRFEKEEGPWLVSHTIRLDDKSPYGADIVFSWKNISTSSESLVSSVFVADTIRFTKVKGGLGFLPGMPTNKHNVTSLINNSAEWQEIESFCEQEDSQELFSKNDVQVSFNGFSSHYFAKLLLPETKKSNLSVGKLATSAQKSCSLYVRHQMDQGTVASGESVSFKFRSWFGPKSQAVMTAYAPELKEVMDLGMFSAISHIFLQVLEFLYGALGNWGLAIIVFTVLLKTLLYPLVKSSSTSMYRMKALQPQMNAIKEKFKNDPQRQQQETLKFMSEHKVNPLKGCLPILPQFPLFIACWRTLSNSVELRHAPFFGWISDLSAEDPYFVTPILLGLLLFLQQKLTPTTGMDKTQERMLLLMPVMFSLFMLTLPAGMVLYSLTNSVVSIAQQQWLNRKLGKAQ